MISFARVAGPEIAAGELRVTPIASTVRVRMPGGFAGFLWAKPAGVTVRSGEAPLRWIPIRDPTRRAQWFLFGVAAAAGMILAAQRTPALKLRVRRR